MIIPTLTNVSFRNDPAVLSARLRARLTLPELVALVATLCVALVLVYRVHLGDFFPVDLLTYRTAALGNVTDFYYAYWILPFFRLLATLPDALQVLVFYVLSIASVGFACRVFAGRLAIVVFSYNMLWILWFGQFSGLALGGLALLWWALATRRYSLAAVGLLLALTKYHVTAPIVLTLWLLADMPRAGRWRVVRLAGMLAGLSLLLYGLWPLSIVQSMMSNPPEAATSFTLWRYVGPWCLLLWLPALALPLSPGRRLTAITCCCALALPYFQLSDLILLLALPIGWLPLLSNLGFVHLIYPPILAALTVMPLVAYGGVIGGALVYAAAPYTCVAKADVELRYKRLGVALRRRLRMS